MNELSLFTGAGGGLLGGILLEAPIFGDIRAFIREGYAASYTGMVDIITGGFPCQDISCAGSGKGITGERSGLWKAMAQVICIIRPKYIFVENSPMLVIRGLGVILGDLAKMGFDAQWGIISCADVGGPHKRERIWILATNTKMLDGSWSTEKEKRRPMEKYSQLGGCMWGEAKPEPMRMDDGLAFGLDRLKAIGNGQVPQVVRTAWRILTGGRL